VEQEGIVAAGDSFESLSREPQAISISEMNRLFAEDKYNAGLLEKAIATPALPGDWRNYFRKRHSGATPEEATENSGRADI
jgi:MOSC domain-containing protein YiiM